jgi:hypothetical protein
MLNALYRLRLSGASMHGTTAARWQLMQFHLLPQALCNEARYIHSSANPGASQTEIAMSSPSERLLSIMEASAVLHKVLKPTSAENWLANRRRRKNPDTYKTWGIRTPRCLKYKGTWHYPLSEIRRVFAEIKTAKGMSLR